MDQRAQSRGAGSAVLNGRIDNKKGAQLQNGIIDIRRFDKFMLCGLNP